MISIVACVKDAEIKAALIDVAEEESERQREQDYRAKVIAHFIDVYGIYPESFDLAEDEYLYATDPQYRAQVDGEIAMYS